MARSTAQREVRGGKIKNLCILINFLGQIPQDKEILKEESTLNRRFFTFLGIFFLFLKKFLLEY